MFARIVFLVICLITMLPAAHAAEVIEYRVLGPALSIHNDLSGSKLVSAASSSIYCSSQTGELTCSSTYTPAKRKWNERNAGIGLEISRANSDTNFRDSIFGNFVMDSYGEPSFMFGAGRIWKIGSYGSFVFEAGLTGGIWYRTVLDSVKPGKGPACAKQVYSGSYIILPCSSGAVEIESVLLKKKIVPFVLPVFQINHELTGIGLNIAVAPKLKLGKHVINSTNTVMLQATYKF